MPTLLKVLNNLADIKSAGGVALRVTQAAFLMAVQRVVRGVEVEDDLLGRPVVRLEQQVDEQGLDRRGLMCDLAVLRGRRECQFWGGLAITL